MCGLLSTDPCVRRSRKSATLTGRNRRIESKRVFASGRCMLHFRSDQPSCMAKDHRKHLRLEWPEGFFEAIHALHYAI